MKEILIIKFDGVLSSAYISETLNALITEVNVHDLEAISKLYNRYDIYVLRDGRYLNKALSLDCTILNQYVGNYIIYDSQEDLDNFIQGIVSTCENFIYVGCSDEDVEIFSNISERGQMYCPDDATPRCKEYADVILEQKGGEGVISELEYFLIGEKNTD